MGGKDVYLRINGKKTKNRGLFGVPFCIFKIILKKSWKFSKDNPYIK